MFHFKNNLSKKENSKHHFLYLFSKSLRLIILIENIVKQACRITISNGDPGRKGQLMHSNFSIHLFRRFTIFKERNKKNYNYLNIYLQSNTRKKLIFIIGYVCIKRKKETLISIKMNQLTKQNENFSCSQFNSNLNYFKDEKNTCIGSTKMKPLGFVLY